MTIIGGFIHEYGTLASTNRTAASLAREGHPEGTVVTSRHQTCGRGRYGRIWYSAKDAGIWMSVILRPDAEPGNAGIISLAAGVAVALAVEDATGLKAVLKWPNDVLYCGKKLCGILAEICFENGDEEDTGKYFIILGIGLNVTQDREDFPTEIRNRAISLKMILGPDAKVETVIRERLLKCILQHLDEIYSMLKEGKTAEILEMWMKRSCPAGSRITCVCEGIRRTGVTAGVGNSGQLLVMFDNGATAGISSGEVTYMTDADTGA